MVKLFFAGGENKGHLKYINKLNIKYTLMSYHGLKNREIPKTNSEIFLDSGAYSAYASGKHIDLLEYIKFIKRNKDKVRFYANLDVIGIGNAKKTLRNQRIMEEAGLNPLPVYHYHEYISKDYKYLIEDFCKKYSYVALGGMANTLKDKKEFIRYLKFCFGYAKKYNTKIHAFGMTSLPILKMFPFYSVDSSSWIAGEKFGTFNLFNGKGMKMFSKNLFKLKFKKSFDNFSYEDLKEWNTNQWKKYADYLEERKWNT